MFFNKLPLQASMALGIIAMGIVGILLALYVGESYRHLTVENQRSAYQDIVHLRIGDRLQKLVEYSRELGQSVQNNSGFRQSLQAKDGTRINSYLEAQFHQYFVTAGVIKLNALIALDPDLNAMGTAISEKDQVLGIGGVTCQALLDKARQRSGADRLKLISQVCMDNGVPLLHVLVPIGGFRIAGYLEVISHPIHNLIAIEKDLGLPLKITLMNGDEVYKSDRWPEEEAHKKNIIATHAHHDDKGVRMFNVHIVRDIKEFQRHLDRTRLVSMVTAVLITMAVALLMLYFTKRTTINPVLTLARNFRSIQADRSNLGQTVQVSGNREVQQLAQGYNNMTCKLKELYDELEHTNRELKAEVSERQRAEVQLKLHHDQLEELVEKRTADLAVARDAAINASKAKSQFLANMSHELRTPLNAIIGYSEMLLDNETFAKDEEFIADTNKILSSGKHLLSLINDILDISKIEAGKMGLELCEIEISNLINDVVVTATPLIEKNNNQLVLNVPDDIGSMYTDPTKLRQTLLNLLSNAAKFTENGTIGLSAQRLLQRYGEESVQFKVEDNGIGLDRHQIENIFRAFSQADASTTRKYGGTGLGLAISAHYCEVMGGELVADGEPHKGSVFTITLPARVNELAALNTEPEKSHQPMSKQRIVGS